MDQEIAMRLTSVLFGLTVFILAGMSFTAPSQKKSAEVPPLRSQKISSLKTSAPKSRDRSPAQIKSVTLTEAQNLLKTIEQLEKCYGTENCNYPQTDPRSYELALNQDIARHLKEFKKRFPGSREYADLARKYMRSSDGYIQEAALDMLAQLPVSRENLSALTEGLAGTADAQLLRQALPQLERYLGTAMEKQVHSFLSSTITTGAHFSSEAAAQGIFPFINSSSYRVYREAVESLPAGSTTLRNLSSALKEFSRQQTGA